MKQAILMSILVATIAIPARAASEPNPRLALKKAVAYAFLFNVIYWMLLLVVYPRLA